MASATAKEVANYASAGAIAEEVLTSARTVVSFNAQQYECDRLECHAYIGVPTKILLFYSILLYA